MDGFCPSFVTVYGGSLRKAETAQLGSSLFEGLPTPPSPRFDHSYAILVNGIGGTGVVTIGAVLGMAAHLEDKSISIYDMTGFAQKGGAVQSHLRIGDKQEDITTIAIGPGDADLILGCDLVVTAGESSMRAIEPGRTRAVVNSDPVATAALQQVRDFEVPSSTMAQGIKNALGDNVAMVDATKIAYALTGNSIASNMFLVGYAFQQGWLPLSEEAMMRAIEINGVSVDFNQNAFKLGRVAAHDMGRLEPLLADYIQSVTPDVAATPKQALQRRMQYLTDYQNAAWADRYRKFVDQVAAVESQKTPGQTALSEAVMRNYFKLMAYKDEYEVARLYSNGEFRNNLERQFDGDYEIAFNLAPPLITRRDPKTGKLKKREFGSSMIKGFEILAKLKGLRGTAFDIFGYSAERKMERQLIEDYRQTIGDLLDSLNSDNYAIAVQLASQPAEIRGFGHVKEEAVAKATAEKRSLLEAFARAGATIASDGAVRYQEALR